MFSSRVLKVAPLALYRLDLVDARGVNGTECDVDAIEDQRRERKRPTREPARLKEMLDGA